MKKTFLITSILMMISVGCSTMKNKKESAADNKKIPPSLKNAEFKTLWIPDKIESDRFEEGHYLYIIDKPATWRAE